MSEQSEILQKEHVVVPPELAQRMGEATRMVESEMRDPVAEVANATGQMSMMAEFGALAKESLGRRAGLMFKDAKAALGVLPFINKISEAISPAKATVSLGETISSAVKAENDVLKAERALAAKQSSWDSARGRVDRTMNTEKKTGLDTAASNASNALTEKLQAEKLLQQKQAEFQGKLSQSTEQILATGKNTNEKLTSKAARSLAGIRTDSDYVIRYEKARARASEINADRIAKAVKKGIPQEKVQLLTDADVIRWTGNGDMPARTWLGERGKGLKKVGVHLLLENLGPIINPVPDVPGVVTLASYGAEVFGGQWWAGLIPSAWQYLHNRYEDVQISFETTKKAADIIKRHWNKRIDKLEDARVAKAAGVFL